MDTLPEDLLFVVFSFCSPGDINRILPRVCSEWNAVAQHSALWQQYIDNIPSQYIENIKRYETIPRDKKLFFKWRVHNQQILHKYILNTIDSDLVPLFTKHIVWDICWRITIVSDEFDETTNSPILHAYLLNFERQNTTQDRIELQIHLTDTQYNEYKLKQSTGTDLCDFFVIEGRARFTPLIFTQRAMNRQKSIIKIDTFDLRTIEDVETSVKHNLVDTPTSTKYPRPYEQMKHQWLSFAQNTNTPVEFDRFHYHQYFVGTLVYCDARITSVDRDHGRYTVQLVNNLNDSIVEKDTSSVWTSIKQGINNGIDYLLLNKSILPDLYTMLNNSVDQVSYTREPRTLTLFSSNVHQNKSLHHHNFVYSNKYMNRMFDDGDTVRILARFVTVDQLVVYEMSLRGTSGPCYRKAIWDSAVVLFAISLFLSRYGGKLYNVKKLITSMWHDFDMYIASGIKIVMGLSLELERKDATYDDDEDDEIFDYCDDDSLSQLISKLILALLMRAIGNVVLKLVKWMWRVLVVPSTSMDVAQGTALTYVVKYSLAWGIISYAWMKSRSKLMQHVYSILLYFTFKRNLRNKT